MRLSRLLLSSALVLTISMPCLAKTKSRRHVLHGLHLKRHSAQRGQRSIDDQRATQFQAALVKAGYLTSGEASGHWDATTQSAMQKFQSDNGWQTKLVPDSRAIIKLGLGPTQDAPSGSPVANTPPSPGIASAATAGAAFLQQ